MTLLFIRLPGHDGHDLLWPWEQDHDLRRALVSHPVACSRCVLATGAVFGTDTLQFTFTPGCAEGAQLAQTMRAHAAAKRASR